MAVRRAGALLLAGALAGTALPACGSTAGEAGPDEATVDDCAGERPGPAAAIGMDPATGEERWSRTLGENGQQISAGGVLVVMDRAGAATGIDPATGRALWCRDDAPPVDSSVSPMGTAAVASGTTVVAFSPPSTLVAFDARTGEDLWSTTTAPAVTAFPRVRDGLVMLVENVLEVTYAGEPPDETQPVAATVDLATGSTVAGPAEVAVDDRTASTSEDGLVVAWEAGPEPYALTVEVSDATTGAERWRLDRRGMSAQHVGDLVVVVDQEATPGGRWMAVDVLTAYGAADGVERWTARMDGPFPGVIGAGDLVMWTSPGEAVAIDAATGQVRWRADHGSPGEGGGFSEPGRYTTFVPSADGTVLAGVIVAEQPYRD